VKSGSVPGHVLTRHRPDAVALLMTLEMGKPLAEARGEVTYGAEFLRWFSEEAARVSGRYSAAPDGRNRILVQKKPVGPCLLITPLLEPAAPALPTEGGTPCTEP
jgi:succinate-semialdehyde dehydrogenase/glutarate-semialdehyde dehydrogenase